MNALSQPFAALILSAAVLPWMASAETPAASSNTVIGPNVMLADGADALMRGDWERGVQLTQMGLTFAVSQQDRASALANLCAGFAALKQYQRALVTLRQSIALVSDNWRTLRARGRGQGLGRSKVAARYSARAQLNPGFGFGREDARDCPRNENSGRSGWTCWVLISLIPTTASRLAVPIPPLNASRRCTRHSRGVTPWKRRSARNNVERESNPTCFTMSSTANSVPRSRRAATVVRLRCRYS